MSKLVHLFSELVKVLSRYLLLGQNNNMHIELSRKSQCKKARAVRKSFKQMICYPSHKTLEIN